MKHGWIDVDLARLLDLHDSTIYRRELAEFLPKQVERMRSEVVRLQLPSL